MKLEFSRQIFEKYSNIKFHKNPSVGDEYFHEDGQTDERKGGQTQRQADRET